jgi:aromatic-L-amino-acid decarboxylase
MQNEISLDPENWEEVRRLGHRMVDEMLEHVRTVADRPVWQPMPDASRAALGVASLKSPEALATIYEDFVEHVLPYGLGNIHPRFWGWVIGTGTFTGALAEFLATAMNVNTAGFNTSIIPLEEVVLGWLAEMLRLPTSSSGILLTGASEANFVGIACGLRAHRTGKTQVVYASEATHFSVKRAVSLLGLGSVEYRKIPVDANHRIDIAALTSAITADRFIGKKPSMVIANSGTVGIGGFDDLNALADVCEAHGLWLHVDGAFGALVALSDEYACLVAGIERADSVTFDLHKWLHVPVEAGCVFIRDRARHHDAFAIEGAYLSDMRYGPAVGVNRFTDLGVQQSRSGRALKVWFHLRELGLDKLRLCVEKNIEQAAWLANQIQATSTFELFGPVVSNIVVFRCVSPSVPADMLNAFNQDLLTRIQARGLALPSSFVYNGVFYIRVCIANHRTTQADLAFFLEKIDEVSTEILTVRSSTSPPATTAPV